MSTLYTAPNDPLEIVYLDEALIIANKPSGLLSVPGRGLDKQDCLASRVQSLYPEALIIHRLDMETSGLMVLARSTPIQRHMSILFQQRKVKKHYIAVVQGLLKESGGIVDLPLITDWPNRPRQMVNHINGKPSLTYYRVLNLSPSDQQSRVELSPITGRSHQLRVHMQAIGHPILGDKLYAAPHTQKRSARLLLHAAYLAFQHPETGQLLTVHNPVPF